MWNFKVEFYVQKKCDQNTASHAHKLGCKTAITVFDKKPININLTNKCKAPKKHIQKQIAIAIKNKI